MDNKVGNIDKIALLIIILFALSIGATFTTRILEFFYQNVQVVRSIHLQIKLLSFTYFLFTILVNIGSAVWLYIEARKTQNSKWLWATLGLFAGLFGVILWFLSEILKEIKNTA